MTFSNDLATERGITKVRKGGLIKICFIWCCALTSAGAGDTPHRAERWGMNFIVASLNESHERTGTWQTNWTQISSNIDLVRVNERLFQFPQSFPIERHYAFVTTGSLVFGQNPLVLIRTTPIGDEDQSSIGRHFVMIRDGFAVVQWQPETRIQNEILRGSTKVPAIDADAAATSEQRVTKIMAAKNAVDVRSELTALRLSVQDGFANRLSWSWRGAGLFFVAVLVLFCVLLLRQNRPRR